MTKEMRTEEQGNHAKKKSTKYILIGVAIVLFIGAVGCFRFGWLNGFFANGYAVKGVVLSDDVTNIDWEQLKKDDTAFTYISSKDDQENSSKEVQKRLQDATIYIGATHAFSMDTAPDQQAKAYIDTVGDLKGKMVPMVDISYYENKNKDEVKQSLQKLLGALEAQYGKKPIIGADKKGYNEYLKDGFDGYAIWIGNTSTTPDATMKGKWTFWEYSDDNKAVFTGNSIDLKKYIVE